MKLGVLALQGDFARHRQMIKNMGYESVEVRTPSQLEQTSALIIPGGESTTLLKLLAPENFRKKLIDYAQQNPVMGTCAGLILLAKTVTSPHQETLGLIDIEVRRNAYGRQRESFEAPVTLTLNQKTAPFQGIFIRAPKITAFGPDIEPLGRHNRDVVVARSKNILVATFHPELTDDSRIHEYFIQHVVHKNGS